MPYALKTPLDLKKVELSAAFFRTHLGHRENATELAIGLIRKGVETRAAVCRRTIRLRLNGTDTAERWAISHIIQGCYVEEYHHWEKAIKQYYKGKES